MAYKEVFNMLETAGNVAKSFAEQQIKQGKGYVIE